MDQVHLPENLEHLLDKDLTNHEVQDLFYELLLQQILMDPIQDLNHFFHWNLNLFNYW